MMQEPDGNGNIQPEVLRLQKLKMMLRKVREAKIDLEMEKLHILHLREVLAAKSTTSSKKYGKLARKQNQTSAVGVNASSSQDDVNDSSVNLNIPVLSQMVRGEYFASEEDDKDEEEDDDEDDEDDKMSTIEIRSDSSTVEIRSDCSTDEVGSDISTTSSAVSEFNEEIHAIPFSSDESAIDLHSD